jgi:hypothetical protein
MYCKTYSGDFKQFENLLATFNRHNKKNIILYVSAPELELDLYKRFECETVSVISDESYAKDHFAKIGHHGMSIGYSNQQICKLTFYKTGFSRNYLCIDSDTVFIRDFEPSDFMYNDDIPYTVLVMDKDLSIERHYRSLFWVRRQQFIKIIYEFVGLDDKRLRTCHNSQVFNVKVLRSLWSDLMKPRALEYNDLLRISPYEFTWYNAWFQKSQLLPEYAVEPFFKMFHMRQEYIFSKLKLLREVDYAQEYFGLILNSKWDPEPPLNYKDPSGFNYRVFYKIITGDNFIYRFYIRLARKGFMLRVFRKLFLNPKS